VAWRAARARRQRIASARQVRQSLLSSPRSIAGDYIGDIAIPVLNLRCPRGRRFA
jgi:hypothetical protein